MDAVRWEGRMEVVNKINGLDLKLGRISSPKTCH
jgi:hypothetical protein